MHRFLKFLERTCIVTGLTLITLGVTVRVDGMIERKAAVAEFERIRTSIGHEVDQSDWSEKRKAGYRKALQQDAGTTVAVLRIPARNIEVPVFDSIDETALNRGSGHVAGTTVPGGRGNVAIAAHRDGFFRGLKDIELGDVIELATISGRQVFRVSQLDIVDPLDVSVLEPSNDTVITLITCYPFYYLGPAPDRFIVRATLVTKENNNENT